MATYRLFGGTTGPATASPAPSTGLLTGLAFQVTSGGCWLDGYWYWVCESGQNTSGQKFALWAVYDALPQDEGVVVSDATVTSGALVPGQWNFVPLPQVVTLSIGTWYVVLTGSTIGCPASGDMFGPGEEYVNGVTNGPLMAASDVNPYTVLGGSVLQSPAITGMGSDPTQYLPLYDNYYGVSVPAYYWIDPQVTTEAPAGGSYRLWPSMPVVSGVGGRSTDPPDTTEQSLGTEFWLSDEYAEYVLDKIWFWSPVASASTMGDPKAALLPGQCAIFDVTTRAVVAGTLQTSPDWRDANGSAASPGDGWVYCSYNRVTLPPGKYKTAVYTKAGGTAQGTQFLFFAELPFYFGDDPDTGSPGVASANGIVSGPLSSPDLANASLAMANGSLSTVPAGTLVPSNSTYQNNDSTNTGEFLYPYTFDSKDNGEVRWVDVEVTPVAQPASGARRAGLLSSIFP
jgi:hypothetical protein